MYVLVVCVCACVPDSTTLPREVDRNADRNILNMICRAKMDSSAGVTASSCRFTWLALNNSSVCMYVCMYVCIYVYLNG